ncbi:MAG: CHASE3 domain-containing protein [Siphonobacter sp.]
MKSPRIWLLNLSAATAMAILILLTYLCLDQVQSGLWFNERVERTYKVILASEKLLSAAKDTETGLRGYLLSKNQLFLRTYKEGRGHFDAAVKTIIPLVNDNIHQSRRIAILRNLAKDKWVTMDQNIANPNASASQIEADVLKSKASLDAIKDVIKELQAEEQVLLYGRLEARQKKLNLTPTYLLVMALIAGGLLIISAFLLSRELRKRIRTQKDLENKIEALNRSNAELEQFAYVASHDLQEPLRKIRAFGDRLVIRQKDNLTEEGQSLLSKITGAAERMQGLINDLLTFSRMVSQKDNIQLIDLNEIIEEVKNDLSLCIAEKKATFDIDPLPQIMGYANQMRQLMLNLLSNALKFSQPFKSPFIQIKYSQIKGDQIPGLDSSVKKQQLYHLISVKDNGIGFEEEYAEKIFVIFQRLHSKTSYEGTGIGLAICRRVTTNHGGYILAEGNPGEGALFKIYLPLDTELTEVSALG